MTSKKLAEAALDQMQTLSLIGEERRCSMMASRVLGLISKNWNSIPDETAWGVLCEGPVMLKLPPEEEPK